MEYLSSNEISSQTKLLNIKYSNAFIYMCIIYYYIPSDSVREKSNLIHTYTTDIFQL